MQLLPLPTNGNTLADTSVRWSMGNCHGRLTTTAKRTLSVYTYRCVCVRGECLDVDAQVRKLLAGPDNSAVLYQDGRVFVWGKNECGALGLEDTDDRLLPQHLFTVHGLPIRMLALGASHMVALIYTVTGARAPARCSMYPDCGADTQWRWRESCYWLTGLSLALAVWCVQRSNGTRQTCPVRPSLPQSTHTCARRAQQAQSPPLRATTGTTRRTRKGARHESVALLGRP